MSKYCEHHFGLPGYDMNPPEAKLATDVDVTDIVDFDRSFPPERIQCCDKLFSRTGRPIVNNKTSTKEYYYLRPTNNREALIVRTWNGNKYCAVLTVIDQEIISKLHETETQEGKQVSTSSEYKAVLHQVVNLFSGLVK